MFLCLIFNIIKIINPTGSSNPHINDINNGAKTNTPIKDIILDVKSGP